MFRRPGPPLEADEGYKKGGKVKQKQKQKQSTKINIHIDNSNRATRKKRRSNKRRASSETREKRMVGPTMGNQPMPPRPQFTTQVIGGQTTQPLNLAEFMKRIVGLEEKINQPRTLGNTVLNQSVPMGSITKQLNDEGKQETVLAPQPMITNDEEEINIGSAGPAVSSASAFEEDVDEPGFVVARKKVKAKREKGEYLDTGVDLVNSRDKAIPIYVNSKGTIFFKNDNGDFRNIGEKKFSVNKINDLKTLLLNQGMYTEKPTKK